MYGKHFRPLSARILRLNTVTSVSRFAFSPYPHRVCEKWWTVRTSEISKSVWTMTFCVRHVCFTMFCWVLSELSCAVRQGIKMSSGTLLTLADCILIATNKLHFIKLHITSIVALCLDDSVILFPRLGFLLSRSKTWSEVLCGIYILQAGPSCSKLTMLLVKIYIEWYANILNLFAVQKLLTFFSAKSIRILYNKSAKTVNEMTLNKLVKLTTLWTTGSRLIFVFCILLV